MGYLMLCLRFGLRLKIEQASVNDTGWYSCEGFNHYGHQSTTAYLLILPGMIHMATFTVISAVLNTRVV